MTPNKALENPPREVDLPLPQRPALLKNLQALCNFAWEMIKVDHSAFVLFKTSLDRGSVVAQFPTTGFENLLGREVQLEEVEAEQRLINLEDAIEIVNVDDPKERESLGPVAVLLDEFNIKSLYIVSVRVRDEVIGSFSLDREKPVGFTEHEKALCKSLARLASLTIENALWSEWLELFEESTKAIISQQQIRPLLETIMNHAVTLLEVEEAGIYERHGDTQEEYLLLSASSRPEAERILRRSDGGMAWQLIDGNDDGQGFLQTTDYSTYEHRAKNIYEIDRFGSVLEVPMTWLNERIGVLFVAAKQGRRFGQFSATRLQRIADLATLAIQRCRVLSRIESISNASFEFSKSLDTESLNSRLTTIAKHASEILGAEMCGVFRIRGDEMTLEASFGHAEGGFPMKKSFRIEDEIKSGLTGAIAYRLRHQFFDSVAKGQADDFKAFFNMTGPELSSDTAVRGDFDHSPSGKCYSLMAIPLLSIPPAAPAMTGLLRISNKKGIAGAAGEQITFTNEDEWILRVFAEAAAISIATTELFSNQAAQLTLYKNFSEVLIGEADLDSRLDLFAKQLAIVMKKSYCRILFCQNSIQNIWKVRGAALHPRRSPDLDWDPGKSKLIEVSATRHLSEVVASRTTGVSSSVDVETNAQLKELSSALHIPPIHSLIAVPLTIDSQVVGALEFGELRHPLKGRGQPSTTELELASHPATLTAELLRRDELRRRQSEMLTVFESSLARIRESEDLEQLFRIIIKEARLLLRYDLGGVVIQRFRNGPVEIVTEDGGAHAVKTMSDSPIAKLFETAFANDTSIDQQSLQQFCSQNQIEDAESSFLATRLSNGTQARCALFLTRKASPVFQSIAEIEVLGRFGRQGSISLTRAVGRDRLQRTRDAISLLGEEMAHGQPEGAVMNALSGIRHANQADSVILYIIDSRSQRFRKVYFVGDVDPSHIAPANESLQNTAVGRILKHGKLHVAKNAFADEIMSDAFQQLEGIKSSAGMPIWIKSSEPEDSHDDNEEAKLNVGVLFLNYKQTQLFTEDEQRIIRLFAPFVALAVRNQEAQDLKKIEVDVQTSLYSAAKAFSESLDLSHTFQRIADEAYKVATASGRRVNFVDVGRVQGNQVFTVSAFPRESLESIWERLGNPVPADRGIVGKALSQGGILLVNDVENDSEYVRIHEETKSELVIVLNQNERPLVSINIESSDQYGFVEEDKETFEMFGSLASNFIRHANQYEALVDARAREESLSYVTFYYIKSGVIVHRHRSSLPRVMTGVEKLRTRAREIDVDTHLKESLDELLSEATDLDRLLSTVVFDPTLWQPQKLNDILSEFQRELEWSPDYQDVKIHFDTSETSTIDVRVDKEMLNHVLHIFARNSLAAMKDSETRAFRLRTQISVGGECKILIEDTGHEIEPLTWDRIFVARVETGSPGKSGIGLLTAALIVSKFGGVPDKLYTSATGSCFAITLPQAEVVKTGG